MQHSFISKVNLELNLQEDYSWVTYTPKSSFLTRLLAITSYTLLIFFKRVGGLSYSIHMWSELRNNDVCV